MKLEHGQKLVMIGDSITDCGRARPVGEGRGDGVGRGYVSLIDAFLQSRYPQLNLRVINMGISGNTVRDLKERWQSDVLQLDPDWLAIKIGVNDVWRQFDSPRMPELHVGLEEYEETYTRLLEQTRSRLKGLVLITPFYMEPNRKDPMRKQMDRYGEVVRRLAEKFDAVFVDTQAPFDQMMQHVYPASIGWDRVHPNLSGHALLAHAFLNAIGFQWQVKS